MKIPVRIFILFAVFIFLSCTRYVPPRYDFSQYPNNYRSYDVAVHWQTSREGNSFRISGLIRNVRYYDMALFELTAAARTDTDKTLAEGLFRYSPDVLKPDDVAPFNITIPLTPEDKPSKIAFRYRYLFIEDGSDGFDFGSFEEQIPQKTYHK